MSEDDSFDSAQGFGQNVQEMALSYSQLKRYRTCPRQFEFAHVKRIPWGISIGESFGASVHVALKRWGERELGRRALGVGRGKKTNERREDQLPLFEGAPPQSQAELNEELLLTLWRESFILDTYATRLEADFARARGEELMRHFYQWWALEPRRVVAVEKAFALDHNGLEVTGRLDRVEEIEGGLRIIDFKTTAPCSQDEADADLQLSVYALAVGQLFEKPCVELSLLFLSEEGVQERATARRSSQLQDARTQIRLIRERMEAKDYRPTPSRDACKRCPYRGVCDVAAV